MPRRPSALPAGAPPPSLAISPKVSVHLGLAVDSIVLAQQESSSIVAHLHLVDAAEHVGAAREASRRGRYEMFAIAKVRKDLLRLAQDLSRRTS